LPSEKGPQGPAALPYPGSFNLFARWAEEGSLAQALRAWVQPLAEANRLALSLLHGEGSDSVAKKGGASSATAATNPREART
jgi:hypothetical protein